jgi:hypothetical protein
MKRYLAILLLSTLLFSFAACGEDAGTIDITDEWELVGANEAKGSAITVSSARTALNYLTGEYNMAEDRVGKKPVAISVNNFDASWPQSGISKADLLVEIETEGGITRLMGVYADYRDIESVGSVRSLRDQFIEALFPLDPIIFHIGTSIYADKALAEHGMVTIDANLYTKAVFRDPGRVGRYDKEHTYFTSATYIEDAISQLGVSEDAKQRRIDTFFDFREPDSEPIVPSTGEANQVTFKFSPSGYDGDFRYDEASGKYLKFQRGKAHIDAGAGDAQLSFTNVLVLTANTKVIDEKGLIDVDYDLGGKGYYFSNGAYEAVDWKKVGYEGTFTMTTADGVDLTINTGNTMLCIVSTKYADTIEIDGTKV